MRVLELSSKNLELSQAAGHYILQKNNFKLMISQLQKWETDLMNDVGMTKNDHDIIVKKDEEAEATLE